MCIRDRNKVELYGKKLGIIGFGRIGKHLYNIAKGFRMDILVYDPYLSKKNIKDVQFLKLEKLLCESDYISLHCPLSNETYHLIGKKEISLMKESSFLINTSRGAIIDENALYIALRDGRIAGAGLDVFEEEPLKSNNLLLKLDNVIATSHNLVRTEESLIRQTKNILTSVKEILHGEIPANSINKETIRKENSRLLNLK